MVNMAWSLAADVEISEGSRTRRIKTEIHNRQQLLRLNDLVEIFSLQLRELESSITIAGARGEVLITEGRPLVRSGDQYILLSGPVWKRSRGEWYVPEDFLKNALSNIVSRNIERLPDGSFRLSVLRLNQVSVEIDSYPDHLSVVFDVSEKASVKVREFRDYVEIAFTAFLIRPEKIASSPDPRLVTAVEFDEQDSLGSFRIRKGSQFLSFRQHYFDSPARLVIEVYGVPTAQVAETSPESVAGSSRTETETIASSTGGRLRDIVVIDPGHGGIDYGVDAYQDLLEKVITLNIARLVERELNRLGVTTRLTRARDVQLSNEHRSAISNFYRCRLFVGIHLGGAPQESTRGPIVYVYSPPEEALASEGEDMWRLVEWDKGQRRFLESSRRLATILQRELNRLFECENEVVAARLAVLAPVRAPAIVVETGFLTNVDDQNLLGAPGFQEKLADSITTAITQFLR